MKNRCHRAPLILSRNKHGTTWRLSSFDCTPSSRSQVAPASSGISASLSCLQILIDAILAAATLPPNEKRSHAGPTASSTPQDELPALADATCSPLSAPNLS